MSLARLLPAAAFLFVAACQTVDVLPPAASAETPDLTGTWDVVLRSAQVDSPAVLAARVRSPGSI